MSRKLVCQKNLCQKGAQADPLVDENQRPQHGLLKVQEGRTKEGLQGTMEIEGVAMYITEKGKGRNRPDKWAKSRKVSKILLKL